MMPFFKDILAATGTERGDWLIGNKEIARALGRKPGTVAHMLATGEIPLVVKVQSLFGPQSQYTWILRKSDVKQEAA